MTQKFVPFATVEMAIFVDEDAEEDGMDPKALLKTISDKMATAREEITTSIEADTTATISIESVAGSKFS